MGALLKRVKLSVQHPNRIWLLLKREAHDMEFEPRVQWGYHRRMTWFWLFNFPIVGLLFFGFPHLWIGIGLLLNTFYSLYANFCTEYDGVHSSYAAWKSGMMATTTTNDVLAGLIRENTELTQQVYELSVLLREHAIPSPPSTHKAHVDMSD